MRRILFLLFCLSMAGAAASAPLATFTATEVLGHDWPRTMVTYEVAFKPGQVRPGEVRLVDASGQEQLFQFWRVAAHPDRSIKSARLSFMASLPKRTSYTYRLLAEKPALTNSSLAVVDSGDTRVLRNAQAGICVPKIDTETNNLPLDLAQMPGPIAAILLMPGSRPIGGSRFLADAAPAAPKVTGFTSRVTEQGPLFIEAKLCYSLDNGGFYQFTARVLDGDPAIRIDEQYDFKTIRTRDESAFAWRLAIDLSGKGSGAWQPDLAIWKSFQGRLKGRAQEQEEKFAVLGVDLKPYLNDEFGSRKLLYTDGETKICDIAAWYPWAPNVDYFALIDSRQLAPGADRAAIPFLAVVAQHAGNWRGGAASFNGTLFTRQDGVAELRWPLLAEPHPNTLLHTGEYDPDLPFTYGRRQWALIGGPPQYHDALWAFRKTEGLVTLDDAKDWILDWPENPKTTYPRLVFTKADIARLKPKLDTHPAGKILKGFLYFQDPPDEARRKLLWDRMTAPPETLAAQAQPLAGPAGMAYHDLNYGGDWAVERGLVRAAYRQTQWTVWSHDVDELFGSGTLNADDRRLLRSHLAALGNLLAEPDLNPRGSMIHLGNPNMPINRFFALAIVASLIPDHPRAGEWLEVSGQYMRYKLAMNVAPEGAWSELISYFPAGYFHLLQSAMVAGKSRQLDPAVARLAVLPSTFTLNLLTPKDPRFGTRVLPGWGHEGVFTFPHWLVAAGLIRDDNPELAKGLAWAWEQTGKPVSEAHFMEHGAGFTPRVTLHADLLAGLPKDYVPADLRSTWWPGFGVNMRAHAGDPDETYLSYHQGYLVSHCDANQGDFVLYSKGAPLVPIGPVQYTLYESAPPLAKLYKEFGWHSRIHFGTQLSTGGWPGGGPASQVHAHSFSDSADYLRGLGDYGPQRWTRQILFLKGQKAAGPNFFVFRDSFHNLDGQPEKLEPKWWFLKTVGSNDCVTAAANGLDYEGEFGAGLQVRFLQPTSVRMETREATSRGTFAVTAVGPVAPGQDMLTVLYPRKRGEATPAYEPLADGVVKIATTEGIDYVFMDRKPMDFKREDIAFRGVAGAVRVYSNGVVHLVIAEGPGEVSYRAYSVKSSIPVTKVFHPGDKSSALVVPSPKSSIAFSLNAWRGKIEEVQPGVKRQATRQGFALAFDSPQPLTFERDGITFSGRRGGVVVNTTDQTTRLILLDGDSLGHGELKIWGDGGPFDITFHADRITGRTAGLGRFLYMTPPPGLDRLPMLIVDGQTYAPGTSGRTFIVPVLPGEHTFELRALVQPKIWRNWQEWQ